MNHPLIRTVTRVLRGGRVRRRPNALLAAYRWRYELGLLVLLGALVELGRRTHWTVPVLVVLAVASIVAAAPAVRGFLHARYWSVVVQHRLRSAFHEAGLSTFAGRLPAIVWASPRPAGVRVLVSLAAGTSVEDVRAMRPALAAACFAADVHVERHPRFANLVVIFVLTGPA